MHLKTVPALTCSAPVSTGGVIKVTWAYIHTGGLSLTNVTVTYTFINGFQNIASVVSVSCFDITSVMISDLVVGIEYTFDVTAENNYGSLNVQCGHTHHVIGELRLHS